MGEEALLPQVRDPDDTLFEELRTLAQPSKEELGAPQPEPNLIDSMAHKRALEGFKPEVGVIDLAGKAAGRLDASSRLLYRYRHQFWQNKKPLYDLAKEYVSLGEGAHALEPDLNRIPVEERPVFLSFVATLAEPRQRGGAAKTATALLRGAQDTAFKLREFPTMTEPGLPTGQKTAEQYALLVEAQRTGGWKAERRVLRQIEAGEKRRERKVRIDFLESARELRLGADPITSKSMVARGIYSAAASTPKMLAAMGMGPLGGAMFWTAMIAPDRRREYIKAGIDPDIAANAAIFSGVFEGLVEMTGRVAPTGLTGGVRRGVMELLKRYGKEWFEEPTQETVGQAFKHFAAAIDEDAPEQKIGESALKVYEAGKEAIFATLFMTMPGAAADLSLAAHIEIAKGAEEGPAPTMPEVETPLEPPGEEEQQAQADAAIAAAAEGGELAGPEGPPPPAVREKQIPKVSAEQAEQITAASPEFAEKIAALEEPTRKAVQTALQEDESLNDRQKASLARILAPQENRDALHKALQEAPTPEEAAPAPAPVEEAVAPTEAALRARLDEVRGTPEEAELVEQLRTRAVAAEAERVAPLVEEAKLEAEAQEDAVGLANKLLARGDLTAEQREDLEGLRDLADAKAQAARAEQAEAATELRDIARGEARPEEAPTGVAEAVQPDRAPGEEARLEAPPIDKAVSAKDLPDAAEANKTTWYHGSGTAGLTPESVDTMGAEIASLFGQGLYLTDSPTVAEGYARRRGRRGTPTVYEVGVNTKGILNFEEALPGEAVDAITAPLEGEIKRAVTETATTEGATGADIWEALTAAVEEESHAEEIPKAEYDELFQTIQDKLREAGYDGLTYVGGVRAARKGAPQHRVLVLFDPTSAGLPVGAELPRTISRMAPRPSDPGKAPPPEVGAGWEAGPEAGEKSWLETQLEKVSPEAAAAGRRITKGMGRATIGFDPGNLGDLGIIGYELFKKGARTVADFTKEIAKYVQDITAEQAKRIWDSFADKRAEEVTPFEEWQTEVAATEPVAVTHAEAEREGLRVQEEQAEAEALDEMEPVAQQRLKEQAARARQEARTIERGQTATRAADEVAAWAARVKPGLLRRGIARLRGQVAATGEGKYEARREERVVEGVVAKVFAGLSPAQGGLGPEGLVQVMSSEEGTLWDTVIEKQQDGRGALLGEAQMRSDRVLFRLADAGVTPDVLSRWSRYAESTGLTEKAVRKVRGRKMGTKRYDLTNGKTPEMTVAERLDWNLTLRDAETRKLVLREDHPGLIVGGLRDPKPLALTGDDVDFILTGTFLTKQQKTAADILWEELNDEEKEARYWAVQGRLPNPMSRPARRGRWGRHPSQKHLKPEPHSARGRTRERGLQDMGLNKPRVPEHTVPFVTGDALESFFRDLTGAMNLIHKAENLEDAFDLLEQPAFIDAVSSNVKHGKRYIAQLKEHLTEYEGVDLFDQHGWNAAMRTILRRAAAGAIGLKPSTGLIQTISISDAAVAGLPWSAAIDGEVEAALHPAATQTEIDAVSPILKDRAAGTGEGMMSPFAPGGAGRKFWGQKAPVVERAAYKFVRMGDSHTIRSIYEGYKGVLAESQGLSGQQLWEAAARATERNVRRSQPTRDAMTISTMQLWARQNPLLKPYLMFTSQTGKHQQMLAWTVTEYRHSERTAKDQAKLAHDVFVVGLLNPSMVWGVRTGYFALLGTVLPSLLKGAKPKDKEGQRWWHFWNWVGTVFGNWPLAGPAIARLAEETTVAFRKLPPRYEHRGTLTSEEWRAIEGAARATGKMAAAIYDAVDEGKASDVEVAQMLLQATQLAEFMGVPAGGVRQAMRPYVPPKKKATRKVKPGLRKRLSPP